MLLIIARRYAERPNFSAGEVGLHIVSLREARQEQVLSRPLQ
jgi:hypothetical protein